MSLVLESKAGKLALVCILCLALAGAIAFVISLFSN